MTHAIGCRLSAPGIICSLGIRHEDVVDALRSGQRGLSVTEAFTPGRPLPLGQVNVTLPSTEGWPEDHKSRNNQLIAATLDALGDALPATLKRFAPERIGVVMGTSTSGVLETERAIARTGPGNDFDDEYRYTRQELGAPAKFIAERLALTGPAWTLSTACSSGARALAAARRLLLSGQCDAVIAGGADSLCGLTVNGFASLEAVSDAPCQPCSANRRGINIGEAAALFIVTREPGGIQLTGYGESSDAHHISAPDPEGRGAAKAMRDALSMAKLPPDAIGYLNLHGTATEHNDVMEARAVHAVFTDSLPASSSTKSLTGHTLGAAGALEAAFCWLALEHGFLPRHVFDGNYDPALPPLPLVSKPHDGVVQRALSNSFAFGGNNIALLLERT
ncbi:beta-ketoacyl-ACP synthase [Phytohalomonas tamaricis]|uniref:beta-ketoacyl-ACP synthase n=1 Tax=Phytohalomonas tamaricis TaxID=2081032 RepID=UPI000D0B1F78|nr:beta-ketoacyl-ACP synthase [Phytohalomonas tamaricis]